jgi:hypothetical protein
MKLMSGLIGLLLGGMVFSVSAKMPGFDIYVGDLALQDNRLQVSQLKALTSRVAYDNQPLFLPDGDSLLYTSAITNNKIEQKVEQTDSMLISLKSGEVSNLTKSTESEYSPTSMPFGNSFSVIRAVGDKQKLWRYPLNPEQQSAKPASELLANVNPVGYHAWVDNSRLILFVLGEPHTLQLADINKQTSQVLDDDIGPSLFAIPHSSLHGTSHGSLMSYTASVGEGDNIQWQLKSYHPETGQIAVLTTLPKGAYYYAWSGNGYAIAAVDGLLMQWDKGNPDKGWLQFADVSDMCPKGITRLSTNLQSSKIALVCTL